MALGAILFALTLAADGLNLWLTLVAHTFAALPTVAMPLAYGAAATDLCLVLLLCAGAVRARRDALQYDRDSNFLGPQVVRAREELTRAMMQ